MRGFLEAYGYRPERTPITLDEMMEGEYSDDAMNHLCDDNPLHQQMDEMSWYQYLESIQYEEEEEDTIYLGDLFNL